MMVIGLKEQLLAMTTKNGNSINGGIVGHLEARCWGQTQKRGQSFSLFGNGMQE